MMNKITYLFLMLCMCYFQSIYSQEDNVILIDKKGFFMPVGEYSLAEVSYYYVLNHGDTLIAELNTSKFQGTNVVTISAYPSEDIIYYNGDFRGKVNLKLFINKKSVYRFSFATNAREEVHCDMKLSRIPETKASKNFRTKVKWVSKKDTTYRIFEETVLVCKDTILESVLNVRQTINERTVLGLVLPRNTISWYYWIGVGEEARIMFDDAVSKSHSLVSTIKPDIPRELSPFALYAYRDLALLFPSNIGDNVKYWFFNEHYKVDEFKTSGFFPYSDQGNVTSDFGVMAYPLEGDYYIGLKNATPNKEYIDVTVRVVVFKILNKYETKREKRIHRVKTVKVPVIAR